MAQIMTILNDFQLIDLAYALILFLIGWSLINWLKRRLPKIMAKMPLDPTLKPFLGSLIIMALKILLIVSVIQKIGIETTSIVAVLGAASLAIGLAFQGTLSNFASGVMLLTLRPFRVGDFIEAAGFAGTVEGIQIFNTQIATPDNKVAIIPNSLLFNGSILNYSLKPTRRIEMLFNITYQEDLAKVKSILLEEATAHDLVLTDQEANDPVVVVTAHTPSGITLALRFWVKSENYWPVHNNLMETTRAHFEREGITVPYPKFDMNLIQPPGPNGPNGPSGPQTPR